MHLTNYAINKNSDLFEFNEDEDCDDKGHKRSITSVYKLLESLGHDVNKLKQEINQLIVKSIISVQPWLSHLYTSSKLDYIENSLCFQIYGFDVFLDSKLKPSLIEINQSPSF